MESVTESNGFENFNTMRMGSQTGRISMQNIGSNLYSEKNM